MTMDTDMLVIAAKLNEASNHLIHAAIDESAQARTQEALALVCEILVDLDGITESPETKDEPEREVIPGTPEAADLESEAGCESSDVLDLESKNP